MVHISPTLFASSPFFPSICDHYLLRRSYYPPFILVYTLFNMSICRALTHDDFEWLKKLKRLFHLPIIAACEKSCYNLWWYSWAIPWSCRAFSHWREGILYDSWFYIQHVFIKFVTHWLHRFYMYEICSTWKIRKFHAPYCCIAKLGLAYFLFHSRKSNF